ncbi:MAG: hypothetical protein ABL995_04560 [Bryobacteraceae bacterium]
MRLRNTLLNKLPGAIYTLASITLLGSTLYSSTLHAESLLRPVVPVDEMANQIVKERSEAKNFDADARWHKRWAVSLAPLTASQALDASSSYGMRELNPLLASANGGFGMKATSIKFGAVAGLMGVEYLLVKKYPRSAKFFTIVNWTTAGATTGLAVHNYRLPGR